MISTSIASGEKLLGHLDQLDHGVNPEMSTVANQSCWIMWSFEHVLLGVLGLVRALRVFVPVLWKHKPRIARWTHGILALPG